MLSSPSTGLSVTRATPASRKFRPGVTAGSRRRLAIFAIGLDAELGHLQRVLLCGGADDAALDRVMPGLQPPSTDTTIAP